MDIYNYKNYKNYLKKILSTTGKSRGRRLQLAKFLNCQSGFISQVLNGSTHFSLEHSIKISDYLAHTKDEKHFFMLLIQKEKSGTVNLKNYYKHQLDEISRSRKVIKNRIEVQTTLSKEHHNEYYSHWYYAAIHVLVSIPQFQTVDSICERLSINRALALKCLSFLERTQLIKKEGEKFKIGSQRIHLNNDSNLVSQHHTNWRLEAIKSLELNDPKKLHYSSILTMSRKDAIVIQEELLKSLAKIETIFAPSKEEDIFSLNIDFYKFKEK